MSTAGEKKAWVYWNDDPACPTVPKRDFRDDGRLLTFITVYSNSCNCQKLAVAAPARAVGGSNRVGGRVGPLAYIYAGTGRCAGPAL
jgi:hypothetical protein